MRIEQYDIVLNRLSIDEIELVRHWRNHPDVRKYMAFRKYISSEMQLRWFKGINNALNYYFLIEYRGEKIGVINCKNVHLDDMYGEGGIFIWDKRYWESSVPVMASMCLISAVFDVLKISNKSFIQVLSDNPRAIRYNKMLGYVLIPGQERIKNQWYVLTANDFQIKTEKLRRGASLLTGDFQLPRIYGEPSEIQLESINKQIIPYSGK